MIFLPVDNTREGRFYRKNDGPQKVLADEIIAIGEYLVGWGDRKQAVIWMRGADISTSTRVVLKMTPEELDAVLSPPMRNTSGPRARAIDL